MDKETRQKIAKKLVLIAKDLISSPSRRAQDFFGDSKAGKEIDRLLKGRWDDRKIRNYLDNIGGGESNVMKWGRALDFISHDLGIRTRGLETGHEQIIEVMKRMKPLYEEWSNYLNSK